MESRSPTATRSTDTSPARVLRACAWVTCSESSPTTRAARPTCGVSCTLWRTTESWNATRSKPVTRPTRGGLGVSGFGVGDHAEGVGGLGEEVRGDVDAGQAFRQCEDGLDRRRVFQELLLV